MTISWYPIIITDIVGSSLTLVIAIWCVVLSRQWQRKNRDDPFRHYIFFLTIAIACFAVSRSCGHLVRQFLILGGLENIWQQLSPFCGAVNTTTFVVIFTASLSFQRFHSIHDQLEFHNKNLEDMVRERTEELARTNNRLQKQFADRKFMEEERERLAGQLRQAQKMEAIGTLAGGIAHDFNNILTPIIGYTELTLHQLPRDSDIYHNLAQVRVAAHRAKDLVKQIITFSRKSEQKHGPVKLCSLMKETLKLIRSTIPTTIEIRETIEPDSGYVLADPTQIHQLLINLCTNAWQSMEEKGGTLRVSLHAVGIEADGNELGLPTGQYMKLSVSDTGVGMDDTTLERACEPFFTTKEFGKGSGLGLSIVHGIVAGHGGRMLIESKKGKGTTFMIYLPRFDKAELEKKLPRDFQLQGLPHTGKERILLVDDEKAIAELHKITLEDLGYAITAFTDSEMALKAFHEQPQHFDLVITDQSMPKLPGSELAAALLKIRDDIPIILCTGYSSVISEEQAADLGIRKYLMKPVTRKELAQAIREVLDKNSAGQQPA